jgi:hypothetical protein
MMALEQNPAYEPVAFFYIKKIGADNEMKINRDQINSSLSSSNFPLAQLKKKNLSIYSIALSLLSIVISIFINIRIAQEYLRVDGKTRGLFSLNEMLTFGYQYYVALLGVTSLILSLLSLRSNARSKQKYAAIMLSIFALIVVFIRIWKLFI